MSSHPVPAPAPLPDEREQAIHRAWRLASDVIRPCVIDWAAGSLVFEPDLTPAETAILGAILEAGRSAVSLTPTEFDAIRSNLQALRDLRQLGRNAFLALTAAERDRRLYDAQTDTTIILLAMLRS